MQKERHVAIKKKNRKKWTSVRSRIRGKSPPKKRRKKNKDSPCFPVIVFKSK
jgi:hypothetical protein